MGWRKNIIRSGCPLEGESIAEVEHSMAGAGDLMRDGPWGVAGADLWRFGPDLEPGFPAAAAIPVESLETHLIQTQAWLSKRIHEEFLPYFPEITGNPHWRLTATTQRGLEWVLATRALMRGGWESVSDSLASWKPRLQGRMNAADCLAAHWSLERLGDALALTYHMALMADDSRQGRAMIMGGLRRPYLPAVVHALKTGRMPSDWLLILSTLIPRSPLTRLVYLDLVAGNAPAEDKVVMPLGRLESAAQGMWQAHLARSLLGAMQSMPPGIGPGWPNEEEIEARAKVKRPRKADVEAWKQVQQRRKALAAAGRERFLRLAACIQAQCGLKLRFLDQLVRQAVGLAAPREQGSRPPLFLFHSPESPAYRAFKEIMLGGELALRPGQCDAEMRHAIGELLQVEPPGDKKIPPEQRGRELAAAAGISEGVAGDLLGRFYRKPATVPVTGGVNQHTPEQILGRWAHLLLQEIGG